VVEGGNNNNKMRGKVNIISESNVHNTVEWKLSVNVNVSLCIPEETQIYLEEKLCSKFLGWLLSYKAFNVSTHTHTHTQ